MKVITDNSKMEIVLGEKQCLFKIDTLLKPSTRLFKESVVAFV